jgi:glutamate carboxypeptidase
MIYMILDALNKLQPEIFQMANWHILLNSSEEVLSEDFAKLCRAKLPKNTLACLIFEGGSIAGDYFPLVVSRKGRATFTINVEGRSAHAGNAHHRGANAIQQIAHSVQEIASFTNYQEQITFNVGKISGGSVINRVPHSASAAVEMRAFSVQTFETGVKKMLKLHGKSKVSSTDGFHCKVSVQLDQRTYPWPQNDETENLYNIWCQTGKSLGIKTKKESRGGLSDGNMLWEYFPVLDGLGPSGANAHCSEQTSDGVKEQEYVIKSSFIPKTVLNTMAIQNLLKQ